LGLWYTTLLAWSFFGKFILGRTVKDGSIDRRYIPGHPDTFILNGGIQRYQTPYRSRASPSAEMSPERIAELDKFITGVKL
jgi:hypothetical protein